MTTHKIDFVKKLNNKKATALYKNVPFNLSIETVKSIYFEKNCFYCQKPIPLGKKETDRIIPSKGYVDGNCVACCKSCNVLKRDMVVGDTRYHSMKSLILKLDNHTKQNPA